MAHISWFDDERFYVKKLMRPVEDLGHTVTIYSSVVDALEDIEAISRSDLVVVDLIAMGDLKGERSHYGGFEILNKLSAMPISPTVVVFSVVATSDLLDEAKRFTRHIIHKPIRMMEFRDRIVEFLQVVPERQHQAP